jgi:hypothetical protein
LKRIVTSPRLRKVSGPIGIARINSESVDVDLIAHGNSQFDGLDPGAFGTSSEFHSLEEVNWIWNLLL